MRAVYFIVHTILQIICIPFTVLGVILVIVKPRWASRKTGVSSTAVSVIGNRWMMHVFNVRKDPYSAALFKVLPNSPVCGMWLIVFPSYLLHKLSRGTYPSLQVIDHEYASLRKVGSVRETTVDKLISKSLHNIGQIVNLGAGYDARFYYETYRNKNVFELDTKATITHKKVWLAKAGIPSNDVVSIETDFTSESWIQTLIDAGFDSSQKTIFLWQGVNLYLAENNVRNTLRILKQYSPAGSIMITDFYDLKKIGGMKYIQTDLERFSFGLDLSAQNEIAIRTFIESEQLKLGEYYLMGSKHQNGTFGAVVEILVE